MPVARRLLAFALLGSLVMPAHAENELSRLHKVSVGAVENEVVVRIFGSRAPDFTSFTMQNPFRVVVDWAGSALDGVSDRQDFSRGVVRRIETQQFESEAERISRVTITLAQPVQFRFESPGKEVVVRFERVGELQTAPDAEPAQAAPVPEPEDEPPPPDDPVLAELKKQPLPEGPLFEPAEPPPAPTPPPVLIAAAPPPPVSPAPAVASPPPVPGVPPAVAAAAPPNAKPPAAPAGATPPATLAVTLPAPIAAAPAPAPTRPEPALSPAVSRPVAETPPAATLAAAAAVSPKDPAPVGAKSVAPTPLARFEPPAPTKPAPAPSPPAAERPLATFTPPSAAAPAPVPAPAPKAPPVEIARAPEARPPPTPERARPAPEVPLLPIARVEPRPSSPPKVAPEPRRSTPSPKRFGDGFEVIQTGRGRQDGAAESRTIEPFEISRAPSRAPRANAAAARTEPANYSASRPTFYAQSAGSNAPKEAIDSGDDFEAGAREMRMIGFQQKPDKSAVYVRCDAKAKFRVERLSDTKVVLKLFDTRVPLENNKRPLDTSFFEGSVTGAKATEVGADTHVEVDLRGPVPFEVKRIGSYVYLYFSKS